jgi:hypothetical protein
MVVWWSRAASASSRAGWAISRRIKGPGASWRLPTARARFTPAHRIDAALDFGHPRRFDLGFDGRRKCLLQANQQQITVIGRQLFGLRDEFIDGRVHSVARRDSINKCALPDTPKRKRRPKAPLMRSTQRDDYEGFRLRIKPRPARPNPSIAQVEGSGTLVTPVTETSSRPKSYPSLEGLRFLNWNVTEAVLATKVMLL